MRIASVLAAAILALTAMAPSPETLVDLDVTPNGDLTIGSPATVWVTDTSKKNQTIHVSVTTDDEGPAHTVTITLDGDGEGSEDWTPTSEWGGLYAFFNYLPASQVDRRIVWP